MSKLSEKAQVAQIIKDNTTTDKYGLKDFHFTDAMDELKKRGLNTPANEKEFARRELRDTAGIGTKAFVADIIENGLANATIKKHEFVESYQRCIGGGKVSSGLSPVEERKLFDRIIKDNTTLTKFGAKNGYTDVNFGDALEDLKKAGIDTDANIRKLIKAEYGDKGGTGNTLTELRQQTHAALVEEGLNVCRNVSDTLHPGKIKNPR